MRVLIVVTHLLGTGHLARALTLARAYLAAGHEIRVASGGIPASHLQDATVPLVQLPPLRSDGVDFSTLLDESGAVADADLHARRRQMLTDLVATWRPDVIITELFPFGRRTLSGEFLGLLDATRALAKRPLICASVRDILAPPSKPAKAARTEEIVSHFYDAVLVHADPDTITLDRSWPVSPTLAPYLRYTGFVAAPPAEPHPEGAGTGEVLVSAGGGSVGAPLFDAALKAARSSALHWRLLVGGRSAEEDTAELNRQAPPNLRAEPANPAFRSMLYHAAASVSMCGYNTALDILQAGTPAVFVPFDSGGETEQGLRAAALARLDGIATLRTAELSADRLLSALDNVMTAPRRPRQTRGLHGAEETVRITRELRNGMK